MPEVLERSRAREGERAPSADFGLTLPGEHLPSDLRQRPRQRHSGVKVSGSLFRTEALAALRAPKDGSVLLRPLLGSGWMTFLALGAAVSLVLFLVLGSYTRRASVGGALVPSGGVVRLVSPATAKVIQQAVHEGQGVQAGDVMFVLSTDRPTVDGGDFQGQVIDSLQRRSASLKDTGQRVQAMAQAERETLARRGASLRAELAHLRSQSEEQQRRVALAEDTRERWRGLFEQALVARDQWLQKEADLSDQRTRAQVLEREQLALSRELASTEAALAATRNREAEQQQLLLRESEFMRQQSAENEARRRIVITAPRAGVVTLVQATQGMLVDAQHPLAHLLPADATLQVHLFAPSRAVGHVKPGTPVWLRYEAFPFERYGQQPAEVVAVSSSPATPEELSPWQGHAPTPAGTAIASAAGEPQYLITARLLPGGWVESAGPVTLRAGLRVEADLMFENRRFIEWMLGPALRLTKQVAP